MSFQLLVFKSRKYAKIVYPMGLFYWPQVTLDNKENVGRMNLIVCLSQMLFFFLKKRGIMINRYREECHISMTNKHNA
jgi:hypothetical protein